MARWRVFVLNTHVGGVSLGFEGFPWLVEEGIRDWLNELLRSRGFPYGLEQRGLPDDDYAFLVRALVEVGKDKDFEVVCWD